MKVPFTFKKSFELSYYCKLLYENYLLLLNFLLMHELSIAMNIVEIACEQAKLNNLFAIDEIEIEVGELSGVEIDALKFVMEIAKKETILENSRTIFTLIPGLARCLICSKEFMTDSFFSQCPECKRFNFQIIQGQELRVKSLNVF